jgi:hypothetical protein
MQALEFKKAGQALFGPRYVADLARELQCSTRSVRRWAAGYWTVPDGVANDMAFMLNARQEEIAKLAGKAPVKPTRTTTGKPARWLIDEERAKLERR